ncbi:hypothetical protein rosag_49910 [Roseisolibacter agri]|uniref:Uncharacterized protein n=1 Tax=Roseisolibacter agri TaxID=2014610 RepID=A0AA37QMB5_9BACT|nr:hypothetical protein rosag_49910 [Roseisolibacter agri]
MASVARPAVAGVCSSSALETARAGPAAAPCAAAGSASATTAASSARSPRTRGGKVAGDDGRPETLDDMCGGEAELPVTRRDRAAGRRDDDDSPATVDTAPAGRDSVEPILQMLMHAFNIV